MLLREDNPRGVSIEERNPQYTFSNSNEPCVLRAAFCFYKYVSSFSELNH